MPKIRAMDMEELGNKEFCQLIFLKLYNDFYFNIYAPSSTPLNFLANMWRCHGIWLLCAVMQYEAHQKIQEALNLDACRRTASSLLICLSQADMGGNLRRTTTTPAAAL